MPYSPEQSLEGQEFQLKDSQERQRVIDMAFDYRGDVTIALRSGECVEGYLFDRDHQASPPTFKVFPREQPHARTICYDEITALAFTGEDTAFGKSWDDWVGKMEKVSQKKNHS